MSAIIEALHRIRDTASMHALAAGYVQLRPAGSEWKGCCPFHEERTPSFFIFNGDRRWHCHGACAEGGDQVDFLTRLLGVSVVEAINIIDSSALPGAPASATITRKLEPSERSALARGIWQDADPAAGTVAEQYLRSRGITIEPPASLRFGEITYGEKSNTKHPALIALIASIENRLTGIQRTYLDRAGRKAAFSKPKLSLGTIRGGAIRLAPAAEEMVICEGLEDGLTLQQRLGLPTWVAAGAGMMSALLLPASCRSIVIAADADDTGEAAAVKTAEIQAARGLRVRIIRPTAPYKDFNAELQGTAS